MTWRVREISPGTALLLAANTPENLSKLAAAVERIDEAGVEVLDPAHAPVLGAARTYLQQPGVASEAALTAALKTACRGLVSAAPASAWPGLEQWWQT